MFSAVSPPILLFPGYIITIIMTVENWILLFTKTTRNQTIGFKKARNDLSSLFFNSYQYRFNLATASPKNSSCLLVVLVDDMQKATVFNPASPNYHK